MPTMPRPPRRSRIEAGSGVVNVALSTVIADKAVWLTPANPLLFVICMLTRKRSAYVDPNRNPWESSTAFPVEPAYAPLGTEV